jgi:hypothetical protein
MNELFALQEPAIAPPPGARYAVRLVDAKTRQEVIVTSRDRLVAFCLDDENRRWWREGEPHTDALVIARWEGSAIVVFIDLTASVQLKVRKRTQSQAPKVEDPLVRKERQLDGIVAHFHPSSRTGGPVTHGDAHHDAWRDGKDRPNPLPPADHRVGAVVIGFHQQARTPLGPKLVGGRSVPRAVWSPVPSSRNKAIISLEAIARQLGW